MVFDDYLNGELGSVNEESQSTYWNSDRHYNDIFIEDGCYYRTQFTKDRNVALSHLRKSYHVYIDILVGHPSDHVFRRYGILFLNNSIDLVYVHT